MKKVQNKQRGIFYIALSILLTLVSFWLIRASGIAVDALLTFYGLNTGGFISRALHSLASLGIGVFVPSVIGWLFLRRKGAKRMPKKIGFCEGFISGFAICGTFSILISLAFSGEEGFLPPTTKSEFVILFVIYSVFAPLCEEFFYRGVILGLLGDFQYVGVILSAVLFMSVHAVGSGMVYALIAGIVFALVTRLSGGISISFAIHSLSNTLVLAGSLGWGKISNIITAIAVVFAIFPIIKIAERMKNHE